MSKKIASRVEAEKAEDMPMISNDVPEGRLQKDQQVADTESALSTKPVSGSFKAKKTQAKGSSLKQQAISDAITGSTSGTGMGINAAGRSVSGTMGGVLGALNSTPQAGKTRSDSRIGKKMDRLATKLNYTPSEQVILAVDESKPLADAANEDQGYNGSYRNESARSQKIMGAVPGDLMYQRSVDLIAKDKLYFVEGQMVLQSNDDGVHYNPSTTLDVKEDGTVEVKDVSYSTGNFLHKGFHFGLDNQGKVRYFYADVDDLSINNATSEDANAASAHRLIKSNVAELDRINMDAKAGDEKADGWSPLPRAIPEPTAASFLMSSIEADTGAYVHLAYSKASTNFSYQLDRAAKDGLDVVGPAIEQCCGWRSAYDNSLSLDNAMNNNLTKGNNATDVFSKVNYRLGDPTLMIDAYDSTSKYHNKADLLLQPRGWRMHLQTADNNMNPLKVPKEYANVFAANECYSTIDREYDPLLPICMTDKANLITVHNFNELEGFFKNAGAKKVLTTATYTNISADYAATDVKLVEAGVPSKMGWTTVYIVYKKLSEHGDGLVWDGTNHVVKYDADSTDCTAEYELLVVPSITGLDGYTTLATLTAANIDYNVVFKQPKVDSTGTNAVSAQTIDASETTWKYLTGGEYVYQYDDLRNNYIVEVKHPLIHGIIKYLEESIGSKIHELLDQEDFYIPLVFSTQYMTLAQIFICAATPYIARVRLDSMKDVLYFEENYKQYPYSKLDSLSNVPFKNYLNFNYSDYDSPLECKVMNASQAIGWTMPEFFWKVDTEKYVLPWYFNENDLNVDGTVDDDAANMSMPSIRSGIRFSFLDNFYGMSEKDIRLSLDRMTKYFLKDSDINSFNAYKYGRTTDGQILANLQSTKLFTVGKILSCPRELGLVMDAPLGVLTRDPADVGVATLLTTPLKALTDDGTATSYRIKIWTNNNTLQHPTILAASGVNINRAANYTQKWFELTANNATSNTDVAGLVFGLADETGVYSPFAVLGTGASAGNGVSVISLQRSLNTRIQFLPFIISPFDGNYTGSYTHDIYDFAYFFGLAGFRASDYRESVYNREKEVINAGLTFTEDPWILDSSLIKGAISSTGVTMTKGYELN